VPFLGTVVNAAAVLAGTAAGLFIGARLSERLRAAVLSSLGLATVFIGLTMLIGSLYVRPLVLIGSLVVGTVIGELLGIEKHLECLGEWLRDRAAGYGQGRFVEGFIAASLLFCVGPMTVLGSLQDGLAGNHSILFAKSVLDGFASIALAAGLGIGVGFAAFTIVLYQGALTVIGLLASDIIDPGAFVAFTAVGGLLVVGIGTNLIGATRLRVGNMLPSILIAAGVDMIVALSALGAAL
jgi:uncharacterized membrane protein YqgA involved in biofilm formation